MLTSVWNSKRGLCQVPSYPAPHLLELENASSCGHPRGAGREPRDRSPLQGGSLERACCVRSGQCTTPGGSAVQPGLRGELRLRLRTPESVQRPRSGSGLWRGPSVVAGGLGSSRNPALRRWARNCRPLPRAGPAATAPLHIRAGVLRQFATSAPRGAAGSPDPLPNPGGTCACGRPAPFPAPWPLGGRHAAGPPAPLPRRVDVVLRIPLEFPS